MNRKDYHIGPGAASLLLIVVVLAMTVLGMLSMMNARSDNRLSMRSAEVAEEAYGLSAAAERTLAELDALLLSCEELTSDDEGWLDLVAEVLPQGMSIEGRLITWTERWEDGRKLVCIIELNEYGTSPRTVWLEHKLHTQLEDMEPQEETWEIWF